MVKLSGYSVQLYQNKTFVALKNKNNIDNAKKSKNLSRIFRLVIFMCETEWKFNNKREKTLYATSK